MEKDFRAEQSSDAIKTPKRIAFIRGRSRARVHREEEDMVMTVPHLVVREIIAFEIVVIVLAIASLLFNAPLEWIANPEHTPNPAKAPWYFLGLQELLHYFPPVVAGVILPFLVVIALVVIPYVPINLKREGLWTHQPKETLIVVLVISGVTSVVLFMFDVYAMLIPTAVLTALMIAPLGVAEQSLTYLRSRSLSWWIMVWFVTNVVVLTAIGTLFRGPGWGWTWPWNGIY